MLTPFRLAACGALVLAGTCLVSVQAGDAKAEPTRKESQPLLDKALAFLKTQQAADGSFSAERVGPGITAVVVAALLRSGQSPKEPVIAKALVYLEKNVKDDGGVYDKYLANYTTSVAVMAFKEANKDGRYDAVLKNAAKFLKGLQQPDGPDEHAKIFGGGFGYDKPNDPKSRPDASNSAFAVEALLASGLDKND